MYFLSIISDWHLVFKKARNGASTGTLNCERQRFRGTGTHRVHLRISSTQQCAWPAAGLKDYHMAETELTLVHQRSTPLKWEAAHIAKLAKGPVFITWR